MYYRCNSRLSILISSNNNHKMQFNFISSPKNQLYILVYNMCLQCKVQPLDQHLPLVSILNLILCTIFLLDTGMANKFVRLCFAKQLTTINPL